MYIKASQYYYKKYYQTLVKVCAFLNGIQNQHYCNFVNLQIFFITLWCIGESFIFLNEINLNTFPYCKDEFFFSLSNTLQAIGNHYSVNTNL